MTLEQTDSKVTPYQALLTKIYIKLPTFSLDSTGQSNNVQFINNIGRKTSLSEKQKKLWKEYKLIQYDQTNGIYFSYNMNFYN